MKRSGGPDNRAPVVKDTPTLKSVGVVGPGQRLRHARIAAGHSEAYIAQQLRLSVHIIKAIDNDDYSFGARLLYLKGYLKAYAKIVGLPANDILAAFSQLDVPEPPRIYPEIPLIQKLPNGLGHYLRMPKWLWPVVMLLSVTVAIAWWHTHEFRSRLNLTAMENEVLPHMSQNMPANAIDTRLPEAVKPAAVVKQVPAVVAGSEQEIAPPSATTPATKPIHTTIDEGAFKRVSFPVTLVFKDDCWVQASDAAGQTVYRGLKRTGEHLRLIGGAPVALTLGNAHGVQVQYAGGSMDLSSYPPQQIAHLQLGQAPEVS